MKRKNKKPRIDRTDRKLKYRRKIIKKKKVKKNRFSENNKKNKTNPFKIKQNQREKKGIKRYKN